MKKKISYYLIYIFSIAIIVSFVFPAVAHAGIISDLKNKIFNRNSEIKKLQEEIVKYQSNVRETKAEAQTLEGELGKLESARRNLVGNIRTTDRQIVKAESTIKNISSEISEKESKIHSNEDELSKTLRLLNELESRTLVEIILSHNSFSSFWDNVESLGQFQAGVHNSIKSLQKLKTSLEAERRKFEKEKRNLITYESLLDDQKRIVESNKRAKDRLLRETKNKESNYKKILAEREAKKDALEREIVAFEEQLRIEIDPSSLPSVRPGVLEWPLDKVRLTQYFGNTPFSTKNPQVYGGKGHNGIDLGAPTGTVVRSAQSGIVRDYGNTDLIRGCYSYGKWILIEHFNGLSTLYAHLSLIKVTKGEEINVGDIIGYSGNTGYSTGPHLHFTVYATKGVSIVRLGDIKKITNCGNAHIPVASFNAYLNPLSYLP